MLSAFLAAHRKATQPFLFFWHNGAEIVIRHRGGRAFDAWHELGFDVVQGTSARGHRPRAGQTAYILTVLPGDDDVADDLVWLAGHPNVVVAIDVCFPFTAPMFAMSFGRDERYPEYRDGAEYWADMRHREPAIRALEAADVVTVPWAQSLACETFLEDMKVFNPNTVVLPDLDGTQESTHAFMRNLMRLWEAGLRAKRDR